MRRVNLNGENQYNENPFVNRFEEFFGTVYKKQIEKLGSQYPEKKSLFLDFADIEHFDPTLADEILTNPDYLLEAAKEAIKKIHIPVLEIDEFSPHIRILNLPDDQRSNLRNISADHLNKLISVDGVIRQLTDVLPKLTTAKWECLKCGNTYELVQSGQNVKRPAICECKSREFELVKEESRFCDYQKIQIQEPLEKIKGNEQATNIDVYVSDDLVNKVSPGDRTRITGILRLYVPKDKRLVYGRYIEAVHLEETAKEFEEVEISNEEEDAIKDLAKNEKIYDMLIKSIAPSIYGHETIKEAISLQLFGGIKKLLPDETSIRGNIHILLVGEPGLAKSQLLQQVNKIAPKGIYVAGKTTSGVGLTASAEKDEFGEGGWTLKAGALVLASGGIACIDEFDKMAKDDRSAMHEAMEQGMVSVAKAGIVTRFKTDTTILAAANPKYSRFDPYQNFLEQVDLPPTLISRFDLFFLLKDVLDREKDSKITDHILRTHRAGELMIQQKQGKTSQIMKEVEEMKEVVTPIIDSELLRKYISFARQNCFPALTQESIKSISDFYLDLRDQGRKDGTYTATHRQLEALVRLSEGSARIRLSDYVEKVDTDRAIKLFRTSLQELVTDMESGRIDIDLITTGQTHTKVTNLKNVLGVIKSMAQEMDMVPIDDVIEESKSSGIDKDKVEDLINELIKKGDIYRPRHGFVKPTDKK